MKVDSSFMNLTVTATGKVNPGGQPDEIAIIEAPSSETQGQSVGSGERVRRKFSSTGERAPRYRISPSYFQKFKQMPAPDWAQKNALYYCPHSATIRRTVSPEFLS